MNTATGEILLRAVKKQTLFLRPGSGEPGFVESLEFLRCASSFSPKCVYLLDAEDYPQLASLPASSDRYYAFIACASGASPVEAPRSGAGNVTVCWVELPLLELYSRLNAALLRTRRGGVFDTADRGDLNSFCSDICESFDVGAVFLNDGCQVICSCVPEGLRTAALDEALERGFLSDRLISELLSPAAGGSVPLSPDGEIRLRSFSVSAGDIRVTGLLLHSAGNSRETGYVQRRAAEYLGRLDAAALRSMIPPPAPESCRALGCLFDGTVTDEPAIRRLLNAESSSMFFTTMLAVPDPGDGGYARYDDAIKLLGSIYRSCVCTVYGGRIICIAFWHNRYDLNRLVLSDWKRELFVFPSPKLELPPVAERGHLTLGINAVTRLFGSLRLTWRLQQDVLGVAMALSPGRRVFFVEDYEAYAFVGFGLRYFAESYDIAKPWLIVHPDVVSVLRSDLISGDNLLDVLFMWLANGCSIGQTADALFMHRNTVYAKIKKIEAIIKVDISSPLVAQNYLLSIMIIRYYAGVLGMDISTLIPLFSSLPRERGEVAPPAPAE